MYVGVPPRGGVTYLPSTWSGYVSARWRLSACEREWVSRCQWRTSGHVLPMGGMESNRELNRPIYIVGMRRGICGGVGWWPLMSCALYFVSCGVDGGCKGYLCACVVKWCQHGWPTGIGMSSVLPPCLLSVLMRDGSVFLGILSSLVVEAHVVVWVST